MENNEMMQNEVVMEGVAVEETVEVVDRKFGKGLLALALGGLAVFVGVSLYKKYAKRAKDSNPDEGQDVNRELKHNVDNSGEVNSF